MSITTILQKIGFTTTERKVIYFLVITLLIGIGIRFYQSYSETGALPQYDYTVSDNEFAERSASLQNSDGDIKNFNNQIPAAKSKEPGEIVSINTATKNDLMKLPGVGPALADRILEYRTNHGEFNSPEELMNVSGIGEKKFHKFQQYIKVP